MFKIKLIFLYLLLGAVWSCGQDPLKDFPEEIQEGVLKTGFEHFANFEDVLVEKLLKVDVIGKNDLTMDFYEGVEGSYNIRFRLLNNFESKYEFILDDNPFIDLKNSQWSYNAKKQTGTLIWMPGETFTWGQQYTKKFIPVSMKIKKRGPPNKGSVFTVNRDFSIFVNKSYTPPKVYRVKTKYDSYVNLSDGNWYRDYLLSGLNLNFYDILYLGERKLKKEVKDNFIFYAFDVYVSLSDPSKFTDKQRDEMGFGKKFNHFSLTDKHGEKAPMELIPFIGEPYYHAVDKIKTGGACILEQPGFLNKSLCLAPFTELDFAGLSTELYVKHYSLPSSIQTDQIYYKIESKTLCGIYHKISADFIIHKQKKWNLQKNCYLSWDKLNAKEVPSLEHLKSKRFPIIESMKIYLLKNDNSFERANQSNWPAVFYKLPEHIKWQLGGHQPIQFSYFFPVLPISLSRADQSNSFELSIRDINYSNDPYPIFEEKKDQILIQNIPISWSFQETVSEKGDIWKRMYNLNLLTDRLKKNRYTHLYEFPFSLKPVSSDIEGESVKLKFSIIPSIKANYIEFFNPAEDFKISSHIKKTDGIQEWIGLDVSIKSQIKEEYIFQTGFKENILQAMPFTDKQTNLEDIIIVKQHEPKSKYACKKNESEPFFESECECSELVYYEKDISNLEEESDFNQDKSQPFYMESICSYKSELKLSAQLINEDNQIISAYWNYNYFVDSDLALKNVSAGGGNFSSIPLSIDEEYLNEHSEADKLDTTFNLHVFFNLKPEINCFSDLDSSQKTCQIRYYLDKSPNIIDRLNTDEFFFSKQGVQADISCLNSSSIEEGLSEEAGASETQFCSCDSPKFITKSEVIGRGMNDSPKEQDENYDITKETVFLEIKCTMDKTKKGFIDLILKTSNPYIYFLDPVVNDDVKSTVFKRLNIE